MRRLARAAVSGANTGAWRTATIRQCAILVGGLGSRLGALTADTPKPLLTVADRPFLAWQMRELIRFGVEEFVLLTGHRSDRVCEALPELAERRCRGPSATSIAEELMRASAPGRRRVPCTRSAG